MTAELYDAWQQRMGKALRDGGFEQIPQPLKRCPRCGSLTLLFDQRLGRISCSNCSLELFLPRS